MENDAYKRGEGFDNFCDHDGVFVDTVCVCKECQKTFTVTTGELKFFWRENLLPPKRCGACRASRRKAAEKASCDHPVI